MKEAEMAAVLECSQIQIKFRARNHERGINRGIRAGVGVGQLKLVDVYRSVAVSARICKLGIQLIGAAKNDKNEADENQPIMHGSNLTDRMITRIPAW
jgi:hypothetical protein